MSFAQAWESGVTRWFCRARHSNGKAQGIEAKVKRSDVKQRQRRAERCRGTANQGRERMGIVLKSIDSNGREKRSMATKRQWIESKCDGIAWQSRAKKRNGKAKQGNVRKGIGEAVNGVA